VNSDKVDYRGRDLSEEAACVQRSSNSLYCTNRTSLENSFYAKGTVYIHESHRSYWNIVEDNRRSWKAIEPYGSLWKMREYSIGKLCKWGRERSGAGYKKGNERLGNKGRQSVTHTAALLSELHPWEPTTPYPEHFLTQFYTQLNVHHQQTCWHG